jgi:superfamily II DNA or RNA helicase
VRATQVSLWPHQRYALEEVPRLLDAGERRVLVTSPTGGGKSLVLCGLVEEALGRDWYAVVYTNRKLLVEQLHRVLSGHGIEFGVRASNYADDRHLPVQLSSLPTERQRVLNSERWQVHGHGRRVLALVDEAHLNSAETSRVILSRHLDDGGAYVGLTATPIDLGHLYDRLVVAGTPSELRACGALVPAWHYGPDEPDMRRFKQNVKTGEYREGDVKKAIMHKAVFGRVFEQWQKLNPDRRPTILFAPGVGESVWFAEQFHKAGVPWAHLDGKNVWLDGELHATTQDLRAEVIGRLKDGTVKGVSNRFVLREGIDIPEASHGIFATVMGGLQTWLQSAGRLLRAAPGKAKATFQDHGGMWWRHGSANMDRQWRLGLTETIIAGTRGERLREKRETEPIHCPACGLIRAAGPACPQCGQESKRKSRMVVQLDGSLKEYGGDIFRKRHVTQSPDAARVWERMYYRGKKAGMTFRQCEALFAVENRWAWPPRDLPLMPVNEFDWYAKVADVPKERLTQ